ncbi:MAG: hypothetical protein OXN26_07400 [Gammaproteobacteria bacterium]|nr:hypothetical protein [Gammaproteobacteria bacterium]
MRPLQIKENLPPEIYNFVEPQAIADMLCQIQEEFAKNMKERND